MDWNFELVSALGSVDFKTALVCLEGDAVSHSLAKHHLGAIHVVLHHILQLGLARVRIDEHEIDLVICGDLYSHVPFGIIDSTSDVELIVLLPSQTLLYFIKFEPEELDSARSLSN